MSPTRSNRSYTQKAESIVPPYVVIYGFVIPDSVDAVGAKCPYVHPVLLVTGNCLRAYVAETSQTDPAGRVSVDFVRMNPGLVGKYADQVLYEDHWHVTCCLPNMGVLVVNSWI